MHEFEQGDTNAGRLAAHWPVLEGIRGMGETLGPCTAHEDADCAAPSATVNTKNDEVLKRYLPEGSVYIWAAMLDGASTSDAIVGWIVLLVRVKSCYRCIRKRDYVQGWESGRFTMAVEKRVYNI